MSHEDPAVPDELTDIEACMTCRDKHGHWVQYPGRIVYVHDNWRLVYVGTIDGRHEFFAEEVSRTNLGALSFDAAKAALIDLVDYNRAHPA